MKILTLGSTIVMLSAACSSLPIEAQTGAASPQLTATEAGSSATPLSQLGVNQEADLVYQILLAEIAGRRGRVDLAAQSYMSAANSSDDSRVAEHAVKLAMYGRDWPSADTAADRWVALSPKSVEAWQHKVQISLQRKDADNAANAMQKIVSVSGQEPVEIIPELVNSILRQADPELGGEVLSKLGASYPDSADTQYGIGRFAMSRGDQVLALESFERALKIEPENVEAILSRARLRQTMGDGDASLAPVKEFVAANPERVAARLGYSRLLVEAGKYEAASAEFEGIAERFPEDSESMFSIALLALEIKRVEQAEDYLITLLQLGKYADEAHYYLARIYDSRKEYGQAIENYESVQGGEYFLNSQIRSAELYGLIGELDKGREQLANLRTLSDDQTVRVELISSEGRMLVGNDMQQEALDVLSAGIEDYPDSTELLYSRALIAEQLDQRGVFEADLKKVIAINPDNGYALNAFGYFLADRNERLDEAEGYLMKAVALLPDDPAVVDSVGWLYYRQGKYRQAIEHLQRAHDILPDSEIAAHLGEVLWVSGDQGGATKVWEDALRSTPDDENLIAVMKKYTP